MTGNRTEALRRFTDQLPEYRYIPSLDVVHQALEDLAVAHPAIASVRGVGRTRGGQPLRMLSVDGGPEQVLVVGCPHPNEPVGLITVMELAKLACAEPELRERFSWHFLPCIDLDGTRLNEPWFGHPLTLASYHRDFYRPALGEQPEWSFPIPGYFDKTWPETEAWMRLIDQLHPVVQASLHNCDRGGAHVVTSRDEPGLVPALAAATRGRVPIDPAPTDCADDFSPGLGVFVHAPADPRDRKAVAEQDRYGASSADYAARHGTLTLFPEVPLWRTELTPPLGDPKTELTAAAERMHRAAGMLRAHPSVPARPGQAPDVRA